MLNKMTIPIQYPLQNMGTILERIAGSKVFAKLDLSSGFLQIPMEENSIAYTAFSTADGHYEFKRMPFGLRNAPLHFQSVMNKILKPFLHRNLEVYIDDNLIHGRDTEELVRVLRDVFELLRQHGLKLNRKKCQFGVQEIEFLGHIVSSDGLRVSPNRIESILQLQPPKTIKELRSFLGTANYLRDFLEGFSIIAKPLYDILGSVKTKGNRPLPPWTEENLNSFNKVRDRIANVPPLYFLDNKLPIILECDASEKGIGAVLFQERTLHDGLNSRKSQKQVVAFVSKAFTGSSTRWSTSEKEAFAIYFSIRKLRHFLLGNSFVVRTDHRNLLFVTNSEVPKIQRWQLKLQEFNFKTEYIPGSSNHVADSLSRICATQLVSGKESIKYFHGATTGHHGVNKTKQFMIDAGIQWPNMKKDVHEYIQNCIICQKMKTTGESHVEPGTIMSSSPFEMSSIDLLGPFRKDSSGNEYCLTVVDNFSRYTLLKGIPDKSAKTVTRALFELLGNFGIFPSKIRSDHGTEFNNACMKELTKLLGIQHEFTVTDHPASNGLVERKNAEVGRHIRNFVNETENYDWSGCLPIVQRIINLSPCATIGLSPAKLLFGSYCPSNPAIIYSSEKHVDPIIFWKSLQEAQKIALASAQEEQLKYLKKTSLSSTREGTKFQKGDLVLALHRGDRPSTKLSPRLRGPYEVMKKTGTNRYSIQHMFTQNIIDIHLEHLRPFIGNKTKAIEAAKLDALTQEYEVEKIINHDFMKKRKTLDNIRFKIRWSGWGPEHDTWAPYKDVSELEALDHYLDDHPQLLDIVPSNNCAIGPLEKDSVVATPTNTVDNRMKITDRGKNKIKTKKNSNEQSLVVIHKEGHTKRHHLCHVDMRTESRDPTYGSDNY